MRLRLLGLLMVLALLVTSTAAAAISGSRMVEAVYRGIGIQVNGKDVVIVEGREPFLVDGSTYVPLRLVAEALGAAVKWDDVNSRISINVPKSMEERVYVKDPTGTVQEQFPFWHVHFTGVFVNQTGATIKNPSVTCKAMGKDGQVVASVARTLDGSLEPYASIAWKFNSEGSRNKQPDQITVKCEVVG